MKRAEVSNEIVPCFTAWERENSHRFIFPLTACQSTESGTNYLRYHIEGVSKMIEILVGSGEICTHVYYQNQCWDMLDCFYAYPEQNDSGKWLDQNLQSEIAYASLQELFEAEVFEPFLNCLNDQLSGTKPVLYLYQNRGTWASFEDEEANDLLIHCEPLLVSVGSGLSLGLF